MPVRPERSRGEQGSDRWGRVGSHHRSLPDTFDRSTYGAIGTQRRSWPLIRRGPAAFVHPAPLQQGGRSNEGGVEPLRVDRNIRCCSHADEPRSNASLRVSICRTSPTHIGINMRSKSYPSGRSRGLLHHEFSTADCATRRRLRTPGPPIASNSTPASGTTTRERSLARGHSLLITRTGRNGATPYSLTSSAQ